MLITTKKKKKKPWKEWIIYFGIDLVVHFIIYHKSKTLEGKSLFKNDFMWPRWDQSVLFKALELSNTKFFLLVLFYDWMCLFQCKIFSLGESFLEIFFFFFFYPSRCSLVVWRLGMSCIPKYSRFDLHKESLWIGKYTILMCEVVYPWFTL